MLRYACRSRFLHGNRAINKRNAPRDACYNSSIEHPVQGSDLMFLVCLIGFYVIIGLYGLSCVYIGLWAIIQRRAEVRYYTPRWSWKLELIVGKTAFIDGRMAYQWGMGQVVSGLLATVPSLPWLLPMITRVALGWIFFITPIAGIVLHFVVSQVVGMRGVSFSLSNSDM